MTSNYTEAKKLLAHASAAADWEHFTGDRDAYLQRVVLTALAYAVLDIADSLYALKGQSLNAA